MKGIFKIKIDDGYCEWEYEIRPEIGDLASIEYLVKRLKKAVNDDTPLRGKNTEKYKR